MRTGLAGLFLALSESVAGADCAPVDWVSLPLTRGGDPVEIALETAYPGMDVDPEAGLLTFATGETVPFVTARDVPPVERLVDATIGDQFVYTYPLDFSLMQRRTPFHDPGRLRDDEFFRALYAETRHEARTSLVAVSYDGASGTVRFNVTQDHCVHIQLEAALDEIEALGPDYAVYFENPGGGFNWRVIAGTNRLSVHSFGIAVDLNTALGGYWRWSGAAQGEATEYDNRIPEEIVQAFERYGFIWGGKWHHFDGMHFEYRPELILHARLIGQG
jgi:hypothetical protein